MRFTRSLPAYDIKFGKVPILSKHEFFGNKANAAPLRIGFLDSVSSVSQQSQNLLPTHSNIPGFLLYYLRYLYSRTQMVWLV